MQAVRVSPKLRTKGKVMAMESYTQLVPCGKCAFCLTNRRSQWMFRIAQEMRTQEYPGYFLTLTYDEGHVRRVDDGRLSLRFRDVQLYLKRLRKAKFYAKYICVGEYGSSTYRPHYHMLLWTDASPEFLQSNWKSSKTGEPMGAIHFGSISMQSAMYCLKYIIQPKQRAVDGIEATRAQFSKGLGLGYLTLKVYEWHTQTYGEPICWSTVDGRKVALPRYYKSKIFTKHELRREAHRIKWESIREKRREMRALIKQGFKDVQSYIQGLRIEQANRIISKTKYTESL